MKKYIFIIFLTIVMMNTNTILSIIAKNAAPKKLCLHKLIHNNNDHNKYFYLMSMRNKHILLIQLSMRKPNIDCVPYLDILTNNIINYHCILSFVCKNNNIPLAECIINKPSFKPSFNDNEFIYEACKYNSVGIAEILLKCKKVDPSAQHNRAIQVAVNNGCVKIVELLLKDGRVNPACNGHTTIFNACYYDYCDILELLLKDGRVNPTYNKNSAINGAKNKGHKNIVALLLKDERVVNSLTQMNLKKFKIFLQNN